MFAATIQKIRQRFATTGDNRGSELTPRPANGQGMWSPLFGGLTPRVNSPGLYEVLREALPILDGAIDRLVTLDGVPVVVGDDAELVGLIARFMTEVQVGDEQRGMSAFVNALRGEVHEQGFGIAEYLGADTGDVTRLNVADSKGVFFGRDAGGELHWYYNSLMPLRHAVNTNGDNNVKAVLEGRASSNTATPYFTGLNYTPLNKTNKIYMAFRTENADPYGVSLFRPLPFIAKTLLTVQQSIANTFERFGDPSYHLEYKASKVVDGNELEKRRTIYERALSAVVKAKRIGKSADLVTATDKDSSVAIKIIGHDGQIIDVEMPARHLLEQIVAKLGLPAWMLGLHFSTAERLAKFQSELLKQESDTRTAMEADVVEQIIKAMLRARGITWDDAYEQHDGKPRRKAWRIEYRKPNISDIVAKSQSNFMDAQADAVRANAGVSASDDAMPASMANMQVENLTRGMPTNRTPRHQHRTGQPCNALETRPIKSVELDTIESELLASIALHYQQTTEHMIRAVGLGGAVAVDDTFVFTEDEQTAIAHAFALFVAALYAIDAGDQGGMVAANIRAYAQGVIDGYTRSGVAEPSSLLSNQAAVDAMLLSSKANFNTYINNTLTPKIHSILQAGAAAGTNPEHIAGHLKFELDGARWKWRQIARSEIAMAWDTAKRIEWAAEISDGVLDDMFDFIPAPDGCPQCKAAAIGNPRLLVDTPRPVLDTHPSCRCDVAPR